MSRYDIVRNACLIAIAVAGALAAQEATRSGPAPQTAVLALAAAGLTMLLVKFADVARTLLRPFGAPDVG